MVPLCDLKLQYQGLKEAIDAAMQDVAAQGNYILGPNVKAFEEEIAGYCGCRYAIGVGNGTDALHLALRALKIGPGDEVITTPFTFIATTEAIGLVGARPVFADIDPRTFNIDPNEVERAVTPRTRAILPVHLYGQPCDMDAILDIARHRDLLVIEDCAQALGASFRGRKAGTFGAAGCLSFFPSKNLGCFGDGGVVLTDDAEVYQRIEMLRRHGGRVKYHHEELGLNSRLDELQAAILRIKLQHLDAANRQRREHAYFYNRLLANSPEVLRPVEFAGAGRITPQGCAGEGENPILEAVYHQYTIQVEGR
ncbi:MAG: DegT/DnrJ/EryC1/StrS family aminotransferase, partial [Planctomycetes bacterium]|nr:DegT/DnrJ/EryC1/StrS family aminotransferase [Planctomycetota bacterium]